MLGKKPEGSIMRNTCSAVLYDKFSYDTRTIVRSEKYKEVFPDVQLLDDRQALFGWSLKTAKQVSYFGAGVGGSIIGFGATLVAITDDLYKSLEDALSETVNDKTIRWKESAHDSRKEKGCPEIDIGTRWTTKDIIGRGIQEKKYDLSIVVPALDEQGNSFCEDVKTTKEYHEIKNSIDSSIWDGEYMQAPAELEGILFHAQELNYFKKSELKEDEAQAALGYIDVADEGTDSLSFPIAKIFLHKIFITEWIFTKANIDITEPLCVDLINREQLSYVRVESNNQGSIFIKNLRKSVAPEKILKVTNTTNKHTRILLMSAFIKRYCHFLDKSEYAPGSDYDRAMKELTSYMKDGSSKHDDAPDAISGLCKFIESLLPHLFA